MNGSAEGNFFGPVFVKLLISDGEEEREDNRVPKEDNEDVMIEHYEDLDFREFSDVSISANVYLEIEDEESHYNEEDRDVDGEVSSGKLK